MKPGPNQCGNVVIIANVSPRSPDTIPFRDRDMARTIKIFWERP